MFVLALAAVVATAGTETAPAPIRRLVDPATVAGRALVDIHIEGLDKTEPFVVERELLVAVGRALVVAELDESVQRLKNLRIFRTVRAELIELGSDLVLRLVLTEKWTILPIARFGGGGGTAFLILGLYEIDLLGRYLEVGGQYENLGGSHSGVVWYRNPRLLDRRLRLGVDLWSVNRVRDLYLPNGEREGAHQMERLKANVFLEVEIAWWLMLGVGAEVDSDRFNTGNLNAEQRAANEAYQVALPRDGISSIARLIGRLGRLDYDDYLVSGTQLDATFDVASGLWGSDLDFGRLLLVGRGFLRLPWSSNLGARLSVGHTSTRDLRHIFYIGGLDYKRGFLNGQFRGRRFWEANVEFRIPSVQGSWLTLQHIVFYDVGSVADTWGSILTFDERPCMSAGAGVRIISPRIARLVLRLDYAFAFGAHSQHGVSFGVQQFF